MMEDEPVVTDGLPRRFHAGLIPWGTVSADGYLVAPPAEPPTLPEEGVPVYTSMVSPYGYQRVGRLETLETVRGILYGRGILDGDGDPNDVQGPELAAVRGARLDLATAAHDGLACSVSMDGMTFVSYYAPDAGPKPYGPVLSIVTAFRVQSLFLYPLDSPLGSLWPQLRMTVDWGAELRRQAVEREASYPPEA